MAAASGRGHRAGGRAVVAVTSSQRQCLVEVLAYFRAERYRAAGPGGYRRADYAEAEAEIGAVLRRYQAPRGGLK